MRTHRFIVSLSLAADQLVITDPELAHQWTHVLRLEPGNEVILADGKGHEALCVIGTIDKKRVTLTILERRKNDRAAAREVVLYCAILKRENFELVVQKATEVGVSAIVPLVTRRTIKLQTKTERLMKIAQEASEQSGRATIPTIQEPMSLDDAIAAAGENEMNIFFDLCDKPLDTKKLQSLGKKRIGVFIGPEGGWDEEESANAKRAGFVLANLGPLTLRAETAAIIGAYLMANV